MTPAASNVTWPSYADIFHWKIINILTENWLSDLAECLTWVEVRTILRHTAAKMFSFALCTPEVFTG